MVPHHTTSPGRYQSLAQAIQPDQTSSRIKHAPTRPRNPIRETKNQWTNIGGWTNDAGLGAVVVSKILDAFFVSLTKSLRVDILLYLRSSLLEN